MPPSTAPFCCPSAAPCLSPAATAHAAGGGWRGLESPQTEAQRYCPTSACGGQRTGGVKGSTCKVHIYGSQGVCIGTFVFFRLTCMLGTFVLLGIWACLCFKGKRARVQRCKCEAAWNDVTATPYMGCWLVMRIWTGLDTLCSPLCNVCLFTCWKLVMTPVSL